LLTFGRQDAEMGERDYWLSFGFLFEKDKVLVYNRLARETDHQWSHSCYTIKQMTMVLLG